MASASAVLIRQACLLTIYFLISSISLWLSYLLRFDFSPAPGYLARFPLILGCFVGLKLLLLLAFGQFGSMLSYFGIHDAQKIFTATFLTALAALGVWYSAGVAWAPPRAVIVTDLLVSFLALCAVRVGLRLLREGYFKNYNDIGAPRRRVAIIGAGDVGASLVKDFLVRRGLGIKPSVFFDDDSRKWGTTIHGIAVYGSPESLSDYLRYQELDEVIMAMPSASGRRIREIVSLLHQLRLRFESVPSYEQLLTGKVRVSQIRPVEIQDLLGREPINLQTDRIRELVHGKIVMVTGAGGTIGSELCRQISGYGPRQLILVERSEFLLFQTEQELAQTGFGSEIVPLVADLLDPVRMQGVFERFHPAIIFHAAAHKHVPMMEQQPAEAFRNNAVGTKRLADLAVQYGVERFVLISTDKAINPTSVMGATKRVAELYIQAKQASGGHDTKLMAVRFGNVLGSSGSVIPTFKQQIATGGPVTITHPDVTRYFMTVNEAVGLVLQSATLGKGGEIFVLDMGSPLKIVDLARQLIELSGLQPDTDIELRFTGLRPGEKLFEEFTHKSENHTPTEHTKIMRFVSQPPFLDRVAQELNELHELAPAMASNQVKAELKKLVPEYTPYCSESS